MAFFQKLKERLFKSSSKIEEGLDAILDEAPAAARSRSRARRRAPDSSAGSSARKKAAFSTTTCWKAWRNC